MLFYNLVVIPVWSRAEVSVTFTYFTTILDLKLSFLKLRPKIIIIFIIILVLGSCEKGDMGVKRVKGNM